MGKSKRKMKNKKKKREKNVEEIITNSILKELLFVQEMHAETSIDYFHKMYPDKYQFLLAKDHLEFEDVVFQGSSAEELCVYSIEEMDEPSNWYGWLRFKRKFDYDILYVLKHKAETEDNLAFKFCDFMNSSLRKNKDQKESLTEWKEAKFCLHEMEPYVLFYTLEADISYFGVGQPACDTCIGKGMDVLSYQGRPVEVIHPSSMVA